MSVGPTTFSTSPPLLMESQRQRRVTTKALRQQWREVAGKEGVTTFRGGGREDGDEGADEL